MNTYTNGDQIHPATAMNSDNDYVITWGSEWLDGSETGVFAILYNYPTPTPTFTPSFTPTMTSFMTPTSTAATSPTLTPTITPTSTDTKPSLSFEQVEPTSGNQSTIFEYLVYYYDADKGYPPLKRVHINDFHKTMTLKSGEYWNGWYHFQISGYELNVGDNNFYFLFVDDDGFSAKLPADGSFNGPQVFEDPAQTATMTAFMTPTSTAATSPTNTYVPTYYPTCTPTPTTTPEHENCLTVTSPQNYYYNTLLLSWSPVYGADHYIFYYLVNGELLSFNLYNNQIYITPQNEIEWELFVNLGTIPYVVVAVDADDNMIYGPTDIAHFTCHPINTPLILETNFNQFASPGCLRITSPSEFHYNTILLSWTPINGAAYYKMKYRYSTWVFDTEVEENWLRIIIPDEESWNALKALEKISYSITAFDEYSNVIDGPTPWASFKCK